jgi:hypothetical protein
VCIVVYHGMEFSILVLPLVARFPLDTVTSSATYVSVCSLQLVHSSRMMQVWAQLSHGDVTRVACWRLPSGQVVKICNHR